MIWDMNGRGYAEDGLPEDMVSNTDRYSARVVDVFGGVEGLPEYLSFYIDATDETINFGIFNEGLVGELKVASVNDLIGREYYVHVGNFARERTVSTARGIVAVEAVDFSEFSKKEIGRLEKEGSLVRCC